MSRIRLNKKQWSKIQPHLSGKAATGRPLADDKQTLEAILFVLTTGCRWADLPREYGSYVTAWRRHKRWTQDGTFARIWHVLLFELEFKGKLDLEKCALDGSFVRAKRGFFPIKLPHLLYSPTLYDDMHLPRFRKELLWDRYYTVAPARLRQFVTQSQIVRRA